MVQAFTVSVSQRCCVLHYSHGDEGLSSAIELNDPPCEVAHLELVDVIHKIYS
jgi:hypothetical protein